MIYVAEFDHLSYLADEFYLQTIFDSADRNPLDQVAEDLKRLISNLGLIDGFLESLDLISVELGQIRMNENRSFGCPCEFALELFPLGLKFAQPLLQAWDT